jgi:hypothetical protein
MATVEILGAVIVDRDLEGQPAKVQRAFVRAAKRSIDSGRSVMAKLIAADTGLTQKVVREALSMRYPSLSDPVASMRARTKRIPLIDFKARGPQPSRGRGNGVSYRNPGGGRNRVESAFIATTRGQANGSGGEHLGVFKRTGKSRLPIKQLYGPSIGQVFSKFRDQGVARALEVFDTNFDHEMEFQNSQGGSDGGAD